MSRLRVVFTSLLGTAALCGCSTFGGNVKGSFTCVAPDGICAPSSTIDDRALALISGTDGDRMIEPAGPYTEPMKEGRGYQNTVAPARTHERVLRIVFPAQIDAAGRLHEQTAVHAVVERGEWRQALASNAVATTPDQVAAATGGDTLLAAVERADPPVIGYAAIDPDLPTEASVAAARARSPGTATASADPVGDIKDQVSRKLTAPRRSRSSAAKATASTATQAVSPQLAPPSSVKPASATASAKTQPVAKAPPSAATPSSSAQSAPVAAASRSTIVVPEHATAAGMAAVASVAANPSIRAGLARAEPEAREAAKGAKPLPVIRASSFPGIQP